jgi:hypothetical protein
VNFGRGFGNGPIYNPLNLFEICLDTSFGDVMAQKIDLLGKQRTLFDRAIQMRGAQSIQHKSNISIMLFQGIRPYDNIIEIYVTYTAYEGLKGRGYSPLMYCR